MKANSMHNLAIAYNNDSAYRIHFVFVSKNDALNLMKNALIIDKRGVLLILLQIKLLLKYLVKALLAVRILEIFILVLVANGIEIVGKNLIF